MIEAIRRFLGYMGFPLGSDVDPVRQRLKRHDKILSDLDSAIKAAKRHEENPITLRVRGRHRPTVFQEEHD